MCQVDDGFLILLQFVEGASAVVMSFGEVRRYLDGLVVIGDGRLVPAVAPVKVAAVMETVGVGRLRRPVSVDRKLRGASSKPSDNSGQIPVELSLV